MAMAADLGFEATELRLGLPGGGGGDGETAAARSSSGKRGFAETIDLKLKLEPAAAAVDDDDKEEAADDREKKVDVVGADNDDASPPAAAAGGGRMKWPPSQSSVVTAAADPEKPRAPKAQVVGWPPVRSYRKNILAVQADKGKDADGGDKSGAGAGAAFVKVSMDGAPYIPAQGGPQDVQELP